MKETEAAGKLCPFIKSVVNAKNVSGDGHHPIEEQICCVGSHCMSWEPEWTLKNKETGELIPVGKAYPAALETERVPNGEGHCKLIER